MCGINMKKKQLYVICHLWNDNKRIIPIEHLKDAVNVLFDYNNLRERDIHLDHGDVLDEYNNLIAKITLDGKIVLP